MEVIGKFTQLQYYKWKNKILEMFNADHTHKLAEKHFSLLEKDLEIQRLRMLLFKLEISNKASVVETIKKEYNTLREEMEQELGFSLKDTIIDEISLEVKKDTP